MQVLGTFPSYVTSGHKATIPPQPCLPNELHKFSLVGFLWSKETTKILCGSTNTNLPSQCALQGDFGLFISKSFQSLTLSGIIEQEEDAQKLLKVLKVLKGDHFSTNYPFYSQSMPGGAASSIF